MAINKVELNNADGTKNTLIDLTQDTVTSSTLAKGYKAHGSDGEEVIGALEVKPIEVYEDGVGNIVVDGASVILDDDSNTVITNLTNDNAELLDSYKYVVNVGSDTSFKSITPSTTSQTIFATKSNMKYFTFTEAIDMDEYDVCLVTNISLNVKYIEEPTNPCMIKSNYSAINYLSRIPYYHNSKELDVINYYLRPYSMVATSYYYINANGSFVNATSNSYGISIGTFVGGTLGTVDSAQATSITANGSKRFLKRWGVTLNAVGVRSNATYCSEDGINKMDVDNMDIIYNAYIYKTKKNNNLFFNTVKNGWVQNERGA